MFNYNYVKLWNSTKNTLELWNALSRTDKGRLLKLVKAAEKILEKCQNKDGVYSMLLHVLQNKVILEEKEVLVKEVVPKQTNEFKKLEPIDKNISGPVEW